MRNRRLVTVVVDLKHVKIPADNSRARLNACSRVRNWPRGSSSAIRYSIWLVPFRFGLQCAKVILRMTPLLFLRRSIHRSSRRHLVRSTSTNRIGNHSGALLEIPRYPFRTARAPPRCEQASKSRFAFGAPHLKLWSSGGSFQVQRLRRGPAALLLVGYLGPGGGLRQPPSSGLPASNLNGACTRRAALRGHYRLIPTRCRVRGEIQSQKTFQFNRCLYPKWAGADGAALELSSQSDAPGRPRGIPRQIRNLLVPGFRTTRGALRDVKPGAVLRLLRS